MIKQQQVRSSSRHPNRRRVLQRKEYECPKAFGNNRDIFKSTHRLSQNINPPRGWSSNCYNFLLKINFESRMTSKIFNSETISTAIPTMTKSGNKGTTVREQEIIIPIVVLLHLLQNALIKAKSSFKGCCCRCPMMWASDVVPILTCTLWSSLDRSAMCSRNSKGPRTLPWGTPDTYDIDTGVTCTIYLNNLSTRLDKKFRNTFKTIPVTPASCNLNTSPRQSSTKINLDKR